jgi:hypothetical protein
MKRVWAAFGLCLSLIGSFSVAPTFAGPVQLCPSVLAGGLLRDLVLAQEQEKVVQFKAQNELLSGRVMSLRQTVFGSWKLMLLKDEGPSEVSLSRIDRSSFRSWKPRLPLIEDYQKSALQVFELALKLKKRVLVYPSRSHFFTFKGEVLSIRPKIDGSTYLIDVHPDHYGPKTLELNTVATVYPI